MRRLYATLVLVLAAAPAAWAVPPKLKIPDEVKPSGQYVQVVPETDAVSVVYVGLSGLEPIPPVFLADKTAFLMDTYGKPAGRYRFVAVAASKTGEQVRQDFVVVIGTATVPPVEPPVDPPTRPTTGLYFLIVRPDGPADPAFTKAMQLPEWKTLAEKGHQFKDKTVAEAAKIGWKVATASPVVLVLATTPDGKNHRLVRGPLPLPTTGADVLKLAEVK